MSSEKMKKWESPSIKSFGNLNDVLLHFASEGNWKGFEAACEMAEKAGLDPGRETRAPERKAARR